MAIYQNQAPAFFFTAALLLLAATAPPALAQLTPILPLPLLNGISVTGVLPCPGGGGLPGVNLTMSCRLIAVVGPGSGSIIVGGATTGLNGEVNIGITDIPTLLSSIGGTVADLAAGRLPCLVSVKVPVNQIICPALSGFNGSLVGVLSVLGIVTSALGNILRVTVGFAVAIP